MNGLEMWCDMDVFNNVNSKEPWWEIRKDGVCVKTGGGSDEAPDAAYAEVLHDLMSRNSLIREVWERDAERDRREAMLEAGMF
jgi:hypothetical protein